MKCTACEKELSTDYAQCSSEKSCKLHFGPCSGLQEISWRKGDKSQWKCPQCRKIKPSQEPVSAEELRFMENVNRKMEAVNQINQMATMFQELKASIEFMSTKYDDVMMRMVDIENVNKKQSADINEL